MKNAVARSEFSSASATNSSGCEEALIDKPTSADELPTYGVFDGLTPESETGSVQKISHPRLLKTFNDNLSALRNDDP